MDSNSMLSHKLVVAHVLGHSDFFRRNSYFEHTDRSMIEKVRLHAGRLAEYEQEVGPAEVEQFLDAVMSIEEHFDPGSPIYREKSDEEYAADRKKGTHRATEYDDLWGTTPDRLTRTESEAHKNPQEPQKDILR